jgi:uncharacterized protein YdiU (UPF0061 family)
MSVGTSALFTFDNSFVRDLPELCRPWQAEPATAPTLLALNDDLARDLGADPAALRTPDGVAALIGVSVPDGAEPVAQVYAGHQFGNYSPRLGDGRALLLGEVVDVHGRRRDLHLKGSGRTPFARGGDGKAAVGPMLRELVVGEAMHALGIPTTRALAVVATGDHVVRDTVLPGAVLARVAASHLRVGTFQWAAANAGPDVLRRLADHAIARHYPAAAGAPEPYVAFYDAVVTAQAELVARWMLVGFVHGVMNTDNTTISGETIDYGPCAFIDRFDPATVFSSIDHGGRYAYGNQPTVLQWNLARLAEAMLTLLDDDTERAVAKATDVLQAYPDRFREAWTTGMATKLGLGELRPDDRELVDDMLRLMHAQQIDHTRWYRALAGVLRGDTATVVTLAADPSALGPWLEHWRSRVSDHAADLVEVAAAMDRVNPLYIPRNHLVEAALSAATAGDLAPFTELVGVVRQPFDERPGLERYAMPAPDSAGPYVTFCGT